MSMSMNGVGSVPGDHTGIYADQPGKTQSPNTAWPDEQEEQRRRQIGPAFELEQPKGLQKPYIYSVEKDEQGNMKILFGQKPGAAGDPDNAFLNRVHEAFNRTDLAPGTYSVWEDGDGKIHMEEAEDEAFHERSREGDDKHGLEKIKEKDSQTEDDKKAKDEDHGWNWMIMELIPDPEDPDNPYKARRRIVAQGKGRVPGVNGK